MIWTETYVVGTDEEPLGIRRGALNKMRQRIAHLEAAVRKIADGQIDEGGNRRPHSDCILIASEALKQ